MTRLMLLALIGLSAALSVGARPLAHEPTHDRIAAAAEAFLESLSPEQLERARRPIVDDNRLDWHYVPRSRAGVAIRDLDAPQRTALHDLLRSTLSSQGYLQAGAVMELDQVLHDLAAARGRRADHRDPELYFVTIFGDPAGDSAWAWRLEGHHLSINVTSAAGEVIGVTPWFFGANPDVVPGGHRRAGFRALGSEADLAWTLLRSLSPEQREIAIVSERAPRDVILSPGVDRLDPAGLVVADMTDEQRATIVALIHEYVHDLDDDLAHAQLESLGDEGIDAMRFAWMGATEPGSPHYWRLHSNAFVIEYDNVQNGANHSHTVWRDLDDDFGGDALREHLERFHAGE